MKKLMTGVAVAAMITAAGALSAEEANVDTHTVQITVGDVFPEDNRAVAFYINGNEGLGCEPFVVDILANQFVSFLIENQHITGNVNFFGIPDGYEVSVDCITNEEARESIRRVANLLSTGPDVEEFPPIVRADGSSVTITSTFSAFEPEGRAGFTGPVLQQT